MAVLEQAGDGARPLHAADFFVVAQGDVDGALRREALAQQPLHRLEDGDHRRLVVEGAAPPHHAVLDHAAERRQGLLACHEGRRVEQGQAAQHFGRRDAVGLDPVQVAGHARRIVQRVVEQAGQGVENRRLALRR